MTYDALGRLSQDTDAAGATTALARTDAAQSTTVSIATALDRTTTYQFASLSTGTKQQVNTFPDGTQAQLNIGTDGSRQTTLPDGRVTNLLQGPDPRWGMQASLSKSLSISQGGVTGNVCCSAGGHPCKSARSAEPHDDDRHDNGQWANLHPLVQRGEQDRHPHEPLQDANARRTLDSLGRVNQAQVSGLFAFQPHP